jgi:hypothetical protein
MGEKDELSVVMAANTYGALNDEDSFETVARRVRDTELFDEYHQVIFRSCSIPFEDFDKLDTFHDQMSLLLDQFEHCFNDEDSFNDFKEEFISDQFELDKEVHSRLIRVLWEGEDPEDVFDSTGARIAAENLVESLDNA